MKKNSISTTNQQGGGAIKPFSQGTATVQPQLASENKNTSSQQLENQKSNRNINRIQTMKLIQDQEKLQQELFEPADVKKAQIHRDEVSLRKQDGSQLVPYPLCCEINEFGKYGVGLQLYFTFLKRSIVIFFVMGLIAFYPLYLNYTGDGYPKSKSASYELTTLGNQRNFLRECQLTGNCKKSEVEERILNMALFDAGYTLLFIIFVFYLRQTFQSEANKVERDNVTTSDYALEIKGLPRTLVKEEEVATFFEQFGKVIEVKFARDYDGTLGLFTDCAKLEIKKNYEIQRIKHSTNREPKVLNKIEKKLQFKRKKVLSQLQKKFGNFKSHNDYPVLKGYIVFDNVVVKQRVKDLFDKYNDPGFLAKLCSCCYLKPPTKHLFRGNILLKLNTTTEPSNINWENLDVSRVERGFRTGVVFIIVAILLLITFVVTLTANSVAPTKSTSQCNTKISEFTSDYNSAQTSQTTKLANGTSFNSVPTTYVDSYFQNYTTNLLKSNPTLTNDELESEKSTMKYCYCSNISLTKGISLSICDSYISSAILALVLTFGCSLIILIINQGLRYFLKKLGKFQRYDSVTGETSSVLTKLFLSIFINTALIPLISNGNIYGFTPSEAVLNALPPLKQLRTSSGSKEYTDDFDRKWYSQVGNKIIATMVFNIVSPHIIYILLIPLIQFNKKRSEKYAVIQRDINELYTPPPYDIAARYATGLNAIFVCFFYASSMPLLLIICGFILLTMYWAEKYILLRYSRRPPNYDRKINERVISILPLAIILHTGVAIVSYGSPEIFPYINSSNNGVEYINNEDISTSQIKIKRVLYLFIGIAIFTTFYFVDSVVFKFLRIIKNILGCLLCCRIKDEDLYGNLAKFGTFSQIESKIKLYGLTSYDIRNNVKYKEIILSIDHINNDSKQITPDQTQKQIQIISDKSEVAPLNNDDKKK